MPRGCRSQSSSPSPHHPSLIASSAMRVAARSIPERIHGERASVCMRRRVSSPSLSMTSATTMKRGRAWSRRVGRSRASVRRARCGWIIRSRLPLGIAAQMKRRPERRPARTPVPVRDLAGGQLGLVDVWVEPADGGFLVGPGWAGHGFVSIHRVLQCAARGRVASRVRASRVVMARPRRLLCGRGCGGRRANRHSRRHA